MNEKLPTFFKPDPGRCCLKYDASRSSPFCNLAMMEIEYPETPVWEPIAMVLGKSRFRKFMFMGQVTQGENTIYLYKHIWTRRYLNLQRDGHAYRFTGEGYVPVPIDEALRHVFS